jgi:cytochrome c biogenesis protein CcdA
MKEIFKENRNKLMKTKKMFIVIRFLAGWLSIFLGTGALFLGSFTSLGKDYFSILIGLIIFIIGISLIAFNFVKIKNRLKNIFINILVYFIGLKIIFYFWSYIIFG